eukprot:3321445-Lingulodinium_polyedra.AAC.1
MGELAAALARGEDPPPWPPAGSGDKPSHEKNEVARGDGVGLRAARAFVAVRHDRGLRLRC